MVTFTCPATTGHMYGYINSTAMGSDLTYLFTYANCITHGMAIPMICIAFFLITFIGSLITEQRLTGVMRPDNCLLASSFVTLGLELIFMQRDNGIFLLVVFGLTIGLFLLSFLLRSLAAAETQ